MQAAAVRSTVKFAGLALGRHWATLTLGRLQNTVHGTVAGNQPEKRDACDYTGRAQRELNEWIG